MANTRLTRVSTESHVGTERRTRTVLLLIVWATAGLGLVSGCSDIRGFVGVWEGPVGAAATLRTGFGPSVRVEPLVVEDADLAEIRAVLSTSDARFVDTPLEAIECVAADVLSSMTFYGNPLRSYMLFANLASEPEADPAWMVISLFGDDRIDLRIMRRNELFGVFRLRRRE